MANYTIVNGTPSPLTDVNGGGTDVSAASTKDGVTLTQGELAALLATDGVAVVKDQTGSDHKPQTLKFVSIASKYASA